MATNVLMPLSPTPGVSPGAGRQMAGKYFRSVQKSSSGKGSSLLTRKSLSQSGQGRLMRESKEKDVTQGIVQEDMDPQR